MAAIVRDALVRSNGPMSKTATGAFDTAKRAPRRSSVDLTTHIGGNPTLANG